MSDWLGAPQPDDGNLLLYPFTPYLRHTAGPGFVPLKQADSVISRHKRVPLHKGDIPPHGGKGVDRLGARQGGHPDTGHGERRSSALSEGSIDFFCPQ